LTTDAIIADKQSVASHLTAVHDAISIHIRSHIDAAASKLGPGGDDFTSAARAMIVAAQTFLGVADANAAAIRAGYRPGA
jgi:hypothetical protein